MYHLDSIRYHESITLESQMIFTGNLLRWKLTSQGTGKNMRYNRKLDFRKLKPGNSLHNTIEICVVSVIVSLYFYFMRDEIVDKLIALIAMPLLIIFTVYSFFHEKRDDKKAENKALELCDESYYESVEWSEKYHDYRMKHDFKSPAKKTMKKDMISHLRQREDWLVAVTFSVLLALSSVSACYKHQFILAVVIVTASVLFFVFYLSLSTRGVREWYTHDCDFDTLEKSYLNGKFLYYKRNGLGFGTTHIHGFTKGKVYAVDYRLAENITRKVVRVKEYEDSLYGKSRYEYYAVIKVRLPESGRITDVSIELDEFQVQMAIDEFKKMNYTADKDNSIAYEETFTNDIVT